LYKFKNISVMAGEGSEPAKASGMKFWTIFGGALAALAVWGAIDAFVFEPLAAKMAAGAGAGH
jgi:hypothetical protein